eukprot:INCI6238.8.p1 GENE.INCI6238.8~~INCI6238.8.p1  ORF type:complete len:1243 (+),score=184.10 INCI6238.8:257-3985(+)
MGNAYSQELGRYLRECATAEQAGESLNSPCQSPSARSKGGQSPGSPSSRIGSPSAAHSFANIGQSCSSVSAMARILVESKSSQNSYLALMHARHEQLSAALDVEDTAAVAAEQNSVSASADSAPTVAVTATDRSATSSTTSTIAKAAQELSRARAVAKKAAKRRRRKKFPPPPPPPMLMDGSSSVEARSNELNTPTSMATQVEDTAMDETSRSGNLKTKTTRRKKKKKKAPPPPPPPKVQLPNIFDQTASRHKVDSVSSRHADAPALVPPPPPSSGVAARLASFLPSINGPSSTVQRTQLPPHVSARQRVNQNTFSLDSLLNSKMPECDRGSEERVVFALLCGQSINTALEGLTGLYVETGECNGMPCFRQKKRAILADSQSTTGEAHSRSDGSVTRRDDNVAENGSINGKPNHVQLVGGKVMHWLYYSQKQNRWVVGSLRGIDSSLKLRAGRTSMPKRRPSRGTGALSEDERLQRQAWEAHARRRKNLLAKHSGFLPCDVTQWMALRNKQSGIWRPCPELMCIEVPSDMERNALTKANTETLEQAQSTGGLIGHVPSVQIAKTRLDDGGNASSPATDEQRYYQRVAEHLDGSLICAWDSHYPLVEEAFGRCPYALGLKLSIYREISAGLEQRRRVPVNGEGSGPRHEETAQRSPTSLSKAPLLAAKAAAERRHRDLPAANFKHQLRAAKRHELHSPRPQPTLVPRLPPAASGSNIDDTVISATEMAERPVVLWRDSWRGFYAAAPATSSGASIEKFRRNKQKKLHPRTRKARAPKNTARDSDTVGFRSEHATLGVMSGGRLQRGFVYACAIFSNVPGIDELCNKNQLTRKLCVMKEKHPQQYRFYPKSWCLPADFSRFEAFVIRKEERRLREEFPVHAKIPGIPSTPLRAPTTFIAKPNQACQGKGIFLFQHMEDFDRKVMPCVVQLYISRPLTLLGGYKFDLRVYVLVASVRPLRLFIFRDGIVRICSVRYEAPTVENLHNSRMHLSNFAINKETPPPSRSNDATMDGRRRSRRERSKRGLDASPRSATTASEGGKPHEVKKSIAWFLDTVSMNRGQNPHDRGGWPDAKGAGAGGRDFWAEMDRLVCRSVLPAKHILELYHDKHFGNTATVSAGAFHIIGFDVMVDADYRLWLVEMNAMPSLAGGSPLDCTIKSAVLKGARDIVSARIYASGCVSKSQERRAPLPAPVLGPTSASTPANPTACALAYSQIYPPVANPALAQEYDAIVATAQQNISPPMML